MNARSPILLEGQVYYDVNSNSYLVITKRNGEMVKYEGQPYEGNIGWRGNMEDIDFIERFQPVDPVDLTDEEAEQLLSFCDDKTTLKIGYIQGD